MSSVPARFNMDGSPPATAILSLVSPDNLEERPSDRSTTGTNGSRIRGQIQAAHASRPAGVNGNARSATGDAGGERRKSLAKRSQSKQRMHRISTIRQREGVSLRSASRRMHVDVRSLRAQEDEGNDIMLSTLYEWQKVLDVPLAELLVDTTEPLAPVVLQRARMVKIMKTVAAMRERSESKAISRLAEMLSEQLVEMMPELRDVSPWHSVGQRRTANEYGRVIERRLPDDFFME